MALIQLQIELKMNIPNYCPKWFDISKYEETYQWGREDWAIAFEHKIYHYNENLEYASNPALGYDINDDCINSWQSLFLGNTDIPRDSRGLPLGKNLISDDMYKIPFEDLEKTFPEPPFLSCFNGTARYRAEIVDSDGEEMLIDSISTIGIQLPELGQFRYEKKAGAYNCFTPVLINFQEYTDDELKEMFEYFLQRYRAFQLYDGYIPRSKKDNIARTFSEAEIESLNRFRVLPCLDLLIWGEYTNQSFTHEELLFLLFGDGTETVINPKTGEEWFPDKSTIKDSVLPKAILLLEAVANPFMHRYDIKTQRNE
jgi:hypothetical protein